MRRGAFCVALFDSAAQPLGASSCSSSSDRLPSSAAASAPTDISEHVALDAPRESTGTKASILSGFKLSAKDGVALLSPTHQITPSGSLPVHANVTLQLSHPASVGEAVLVANEGAASY